jgi:hypothetical protein
VTLDDEDGWGLAAAIIGPPTHHRIGQGHTLRFDDRVKPRTLPTEIQEALHIIPRTPTRDDVVPRTAKDQKQFHDDDVTLWEFIHRAERDMGSKQETRVGCHRAAVAALKRMLERCTASAQQLVETHDVLTAAGVPDAKTLRERVESLIAQRQTKGDAELFDPVIDRTTPSIGKLLAGKPIAEVVQPLWQALRDCERDITEQGNVALQAEETVWMRVFDAIGKFEIMQADLDAATSVDGVSESEPQHRDHAKRHAAIRTIASKINELDTIHYSLQVQGFRVDPDKRMVNAVGRALAAVKALNSIRAAFSKIDSVSANQPEEEFVRFVEQHVQSSNERQFMATGWSKALQQFERLSEASAQTKASCLSMVKGMWAALATARKNTGHKPTRETPPHDPCTNLFEVFQRLITWHQSADEDLIASRNHGDKDHDTLEHDAYLEGRATAYVHAMDLIIELGQAGYELTKQQ